MNGISLVLNKSEIGAGTRGSSLGPEAIEVAAINEQSEIFNRYKRVKIVHNNESIYNEVTTPSAIRIEQMHDLYQSISNTISDQLFDDKFALVFSGDHGSSGGTIAGVKKAFPFDEIGVVWIDAHGDLHSPYTSPTGNMHGMPLSTALSVDNTDYAISELNDKTISLWNKIKNLDGVSPKIKPENLVMLGVRDTELAEDMLMKNLGVRNYTVEEIRKEPTNSIAKRVLNRLDNCGKIYISFDVDVMDCDLISHGTGTPVPNGLMPKHIIDIVTKIVKSGKVVCLEFVEVNPTLDEKKNRMAEAAFEVLKEVLPIIEKFSTT